MRLQVVAIELHQHVPAEAFWNRRRAVERRTAPRIRHLEEKQKRQLLDVVAIREPVIPEDVAVVPELFDDGSRCRHSLKDSKLFQTGF